MLDDAGPHRPRRRHGLVRPSFVPDRPTAGAARPDPLSTFGDRGTRPRETQRLHKVLEDAGSSCRRSPLHVLTKSGREMIDALIAGRRDPAVWPNMAKGRMRSKISELTDAPRWAFQRTSRPVAPSSPKQIRRDSQGPHEAAVPSVGWIPGVSYRTAQVIFAEIGTDMSRFPTAGHLASWAGMCPGNNESAGKHHSGRTRHGSQWLRTALIEPPRPPPARRIPTCRPTTHRIPRRGPAKAAGRGRPLDLGDLLAPALHRGDLHRPGCRLPRQATQLHRPPTLARRPTGMEYLREAVKDTTPEWQESHTGVPAEQLRAFVPGDRRSTCRT